VILSRPGRSEKDEPVVEVLGRCVHKQRALNTRLSSGTSAGTFACPAGPYRNCIGEASTKNEAKLYFEPVQKKGWKIDPHVFFCENNVVRKLDFLKYGGAIFFDASVMGDFVTESSLTASDPLCHGESV